MSLIVFFVYPFPTSNSANALRIAFCVDHSQICLSGLLIVHPLSYKSIQRGLFPIDVNLTKSLPLHLILLYRLLMSHWYLYMTGGEKMRTDNSAEFLVLHFGAYSNEILMSEGMQYE